MRSREVGAGQWRRSRAAVRGAVSGAAFAVIGGATLGAQATPGPRMGAAMVYDAARAHVVLFGGWRVGAAGPEHPNDLWAWDGLVWRELYVPPDVRPPGRDAPHLAYDVERKRVVLFGGRLRRGEQTTVLSDVWEWDGHQWHEKRDAALEPLLHAVTTYDPVRRRVQAYGGWGTRGPSRMLREWDGTRWLTRDTAGPSSLTASGAVVTPTGTLIVTGLTPTADTDPVPPPAPRGWTFSGASWHEAEAGPPIANLQPVAGTPEGALWIYQAWERWVTEPIVHVRHPDGRWTGVRAVGGPGVRTTIAAAYDPLRRRMVLYGGRAAGGLLNDTWEFDGERWEKR